MRERGREGESEREGVRGTVCVLKFYVEGGDCLNVETRARERVGGG